MTGTMSARTTLAALAAIILLTVCGCPTLPQPDGSRGSKPVEAVQVAQSVVMPEKIPSPNESTLSIGSRFPMFVARTLDGKTVDLASLVGGGEYVVVWFWAMWTDPTASDLTQLVQVFQTREGDRFHLVTVNLDLPSHEEAVTNLVQARMYKFPVVPDFNHTEPNTLGAAYGIGPGKSPMSYLLGSDGTILMKNLRTSDLDGIVAALLQSTEPYQPISMTMAIAGRIEPTLTDEPVRLPREGEPARKASESIVLSVTVRNPLALASDTYNAKVSYIPLIPTGQLTYMRVYPEDSESELVSSAGKPVVFHVVSGSPSEVTSKLEGNQAEFMLDIILPADTYVIEYSGEVWSFVLNRMIPCDRGKEDFARLPYCTPEAVNRQGGAVPVTEPTRQTQ